MSLLEVKNKLVNKKIKPKKMCFTFNRTIIVQINMQNTLKV